MINNKIQTFSGQYAFLSNFYPLPGGKTVEHFYQAAKACNYADYSAIINTDTPGKAKRLGKTIKPRSDWHDIKLTVMEQLLIAKFCNHDLATKLLMTGSAEIIEGNTWGDTYWGVCNGVGHNHLGKLLMKIRDSFLDVTATTIY